jgi:hypothetical protein
LLAWLLWLEKSIAVHSRWYPVFQRYLEQIRGRVSGFGGDPASILPSATGDVPGLQRQLPGGDGRGREYTGKVEGVIYDRFGDFEGFLLLTEEGEKHHFYAREHHIEELTRVAWRERMVITVIADDSNQPVTIILLRA